MPIYLVSEDVHLDRLMNVSSARFFPLVNISLFVIDK